uniref:DUF2726 domain-containing protein n=1 Tax=Candidatus Kentrum sp. UNK TaxID=2126344 RepID=A0A451B0A6_9GAMM|nr:MAG: Protein of unknown function (DUF2726) [Candidatus Kentron sp. UNK]VFK71711.1 MAG: Protein of unknown function (DUF2726) [Candidatus Kentron sp. UNK]
MSDAIEYMSLSPLGILALLIILVAIIVIIALMRRRARDTYPYESVDGLFSPAELAFLEVLDEAVGRRYRVFGKVRLADVLRVRSGLERSAWRAAFNKIQSKHLDFVVCDADGPAIRFAVELDDRSHARADRRTRDIFVDRALAAARVPLFRFPVRRAYSVEDIRDRIFGT